LEVLLPVIKWRKKNITLSKKFQKFNRKIVEIGKFDIPNFLNAIASYNPTSLTPSLFTEVPVLSQESERSECICVLGICLFLRFFYCIFFQLKSTILREVSACPEAPEQYCSALQYFFWRPCCR
jgi:hypothetical protein